MFQNFRQAMSWVHTWLGLALGFVLMIAFFFGSLSVFDREIDRWAIPETRFDARPMPSFDRVLRPMFEQQQPSAADIEEARPFIKGAMPEKYDQVRWWDTYATHRDPVLNVYAGWEAGNAEEAEQFVSIGRTVDPRSGELLSNDRLKLGSELFYPLHINLTLHWQDLGYWIIGLAALMMLVALVTGVVIHRKFFRELFTFRPGKAPQRRTLDLHNLTGVVALPFHFFFAFTGLVIFVGIYFPITHTQLEPLHEYHKAHEDQTSPLPSKRAGVAAPLAPVDPMVAEAQRRWAERGMAGEVGALILIHVFDENGYVSIYRAGTDRVALTSDGIHFKASTGEVLKEDPPVSAVASVSEFLTGLHLQQFRHWLLRWLYVLGGLAGCVCIATGFLFFVEKRKQQHARRGGQGARVVDALAVTTVTGMLIATLGVLIANRVLPDDLPRRGDIEVYCFWAAWVLAMAHAFWRTASVAQGQRAPAWREQSWAVAAMAVIAVLLNWITTGDHLLKTLRETYWPVAGMDLSLMATAAVAAWAAHRLAKPQSPNGIR